MTDLRIGNVPVTDVRIGSVQIQKVYLGATLVWSAYTPISGVTATPSSATKLDTLAEPAPSSKSVTAGPVTITWSGGNPGASVSWSKVSGTTMAFTNAATTTFVATVPKGSTVTATYRATVSDGTSNAHVDVNVSLTYLTNT